MVHLLLLRCCVGLPIVLLFLLLLRLLLLWLGWLVCFFFFVLVFSASTPSGRVDGVTELFLCSDGHRALHAKLHLYAVDACPRRSDADLSTAGAK